MIDSKKTYENLTELNYFSDLFDFVRESTGIAITMAYLILILTSMIYLHILYSAFELSIIKLITLEDILATPIKNPNIIIVLTAIGLLLYLADMANRLRARLHLKYIDKKMPFFIKLFTIITWTPSDKKINVRMTVFILLFSLGVYAFIVAADEGRSIREGGGQQINLTLSDSETSKQVTLLGTTTEFVIVYDLQQDLATAYQVESVVQMSPIKSPVTENVQAVEAAPNKPMAE